MDQPPTRQFQRLRGIAVALAMSGGASLLVAAPANAEESHARDLFKAMSDYLLGQEAISYSYNATLELVTVDLQKVGFASSGTLALNRPDKVRMTRIGGFADIEVTYDGATLTALGKNLNIFAKAQIPGTIDELIDTLRFEYGFAAPAADLLSSVHFEAMMGNVIDVKDLGSGVIGGQECDHLAFRTEETDWQIWIAHGDRPYPCRFTITSKMIVMAPSYSIDITDWKAGAEVASDDFRLDTGDADEVQIVDLSGLNEIPDIFEEGDAQ
ncbi:MAG: DUF2092 domain-containing protein [Hyphomicrobiales bacterium]|nr:DUF2092 domain-containing protein [Hyphomicrobiales bacterium]